MLIKSYLENEEDNGNGYCINGHYNIIPACTKIFVNNKLYCPECGTLIWEVVSKPTLFEKKNFVMHSGEESDFKIECDALTSEDIETLAYLISKRFNFAGVYGIPTGGLKLANALNKYIDEYGVYYLIVDDVLTTGKSMEKAQKKLIQHEPIIGVVLFSRSKRPIQKWIYPIFNMSKWWN